MPIGIYDRTRSVRPVADRFWPKVAKTDGCWLWTASHGGPRGRYGQIGTGRGREIAKAHRVSWEMANGPIPDGLSVLHRCDTPLCVRPDHLFLGTQIENIADMDRKGRRRHVSGDDHPARRLGARVGVRNGRARLDPDKVRRIRQMRDDGMEYGEIAAVFGVAVPTVQHVVSGKNWRHVT